MISKEKVDSKCELEVADLKEKEVSKKVEELLENMSLLDFYDISVFKGKKEVSMKNGEYTIKIKIDEEKLKDYENFQIVYVNDENEIEEYIDAEIEDGYIIFHTSHLSQYGIVASLREEPIVEEETSKPNYSLIIKVSILIGITLIFASFITFVIIKSKLLNKKAKRKKKKINFLSRLKHS